ncbi:MAG: folate-binding protein YgfZ [Alphaproteobacteria bacterium]|nr:folate-binding protein YgfZ [Alphaproteobacteria bacterium]
MAEIVALPTRGFLRIAGGDAEAFLQGLITVDAKKATAERALYGAMLTPQGKFLFEFFLLREEGGFLLDTPKARLADFATRLTLYKLRSKVEIKDVSAEFRAYASYGNHAHAADLPNEAGSMMKHRGGLAYADPRHAGLGVRFALPEKEAVEETGTLAEYHALRITLGVPDGEVDLIPDKSFPMQCNFDDIHGVDFHKGCFVGQEVTARTKHRGGVSRRLVPVRFEGIAPEIGTPVKAGEVTVGEVRSASGEVALASFRIEDLEKARDAVMVAGGVKLGVLS